MSLTICYERFDNILHSNFTLYVPVAESVENDLAEAEVAPEENAAAPEDAEEADIVEAVPHDPVGESIRLAGDDTVDVKDLLEAEVAPEADATTADDAADVAIIRVAALGSAEDLIPPGEDDDVDIHNLVEAEEEGNIAFGAATAVGLTAAGAVDIGARTAGEDDVEADVSKVAREIEDNIVEASVVHSAENSIPLVEDDNVDDVIAREVEPKAEADFREDVQEEAIVQALAQEDEADTPEDVEEEDIVQAVAQDSTEENVQLDEGERTQKEESGEFDEM